MGNTGMCVSRWEGANLDMWAGISILGTEYRESQPRTVKEMVLLVKGKEHAKTKLRNQFVTEGVNQIEEGQLGQAESGAAETSRGSSILLRMLHVIKWEVTDKLKYCRDQFGG